MVNKTSRLLFPNHTRFDALLRRSRVAADFSTSSGTRVETLSVPILRHSKAPSRGNDREQPATFTIGVSTFTYSNLQVRNLRNSSSLPLDLSGRSETLAITDLAKTSSTMAQEKPLPFIYQFAAGMFSLVRRTCQLILTMCLGAVAGVSEVSRSYTQAQLTLY